MNSIMFLPAMDRDLEVVLNDVKLNSLGFLETFCSQKDVQTLTPKLSLTNIILDSILLMMSKDEIIVQMSVQVKYFEKKLA